MTLHFVTAGVHVHVHGLDPAAQDPAAQEPAAPEPAAREPAAQETDAGWRARVAELVRVAGAGMVRPTGTDGPDREGAPGEPTPTAGLDVVITHADQAWWVTGAAVPRTRLPADAHQAAGRILALVDRAALDATRCLVVHSAAVAGPAGVAVIPGASGAGKSTLAAACLRLGLALVSDEAACIDPGDLRLRPHPRPLGLSLASRALLGLPPDEWEAVARRRLDSGLGSDGSARAEHTAGAEAAARVEDTARAEDTAGAEDEVAVGPSVFGAWVDPERHVAVTHVVLVTRRPGAPALEAASTGEGLRRLLSNCLNTGAAGAWSPEAAWHVLGRLARTVEVVSLDYDTPEEGARLLAAMLGVRGQTSPPSAGMPPAGMPPAGMPSPGVPSAGMP